MRYDNAASMGLAVDRVEIIKRGATFNVRIRPMCSVGYVLAMLLELRV